MENLCYDFYKPMHEATWKETDTLMSELDLPQWSVVSFDSCEASGLTYRTAVELLTRKETESVYGLCIVTDEAAARIRHPAARS